MAPGDTGVRPAAELGDQLTSEQDLRASEGRRTALKALVIDQHEGRRGWPLGRHLARPKDIGGWGPVKRGGRH